MNEFSQTHAVPGSKTRSVLDKYSKIFCTSQVSSRLARGDVTSTKKKKKKKKKAFHTPIQKRRLKPGFDHDDPFTVRNRISVGRSVGHVD